MKKAIHILCTAISHLQDTAKVNKIPSAPNAILVRFRYTLRSKASSFFDGLSTGANVHITHPAAIAHIP